MFLLGEGDKEIANIVELLELSLTLLSLAPHFLRVSLRPQSLSSAPKHADVVKHSTNAQFGVNDMSFNKHGGDVKD